MMVYNELEGVGVKLVWGLSGICALVAMVALGGEKV
jgi:hypothetical protein